MFRCGICGTVSEKGVSPAMLVTGTRRKQYYNEDGEVAGTGTEIVSEVRVGKCCRESK